MRIEQKRPRSRLKSDADTSKFNSRKPYKKRTYKNVRRKFKVHTPLCLSADCGRYAIWPAENPKFCSLRHAALEGVAYTLDHWACEMCGKWHPVDENREIFCRVLMCSTCRKNLTDEDRKVLNDFRKLIGKRDLTSSG